MGIISKKDFVIEDILSKDGKIDSDIEEENFKDKSKTNFWEVFSMTLKN